MKLIDISILLAGVSSALNDTYERPADLIDDNENYHCKEPYYISYSYHEYKREADEFFSSEPYK